MSRRHRKADEFGATHVIILGARARGSLPVALCGKKDPIPSVAREFVAAHVQGHGMKVCPECAAVMLALPM